MSDEQTKEPIEDPDPYGEDPFGLPEDHHSPVGLASLHSAELAELASLEHNPIGEQ